MTSVPTQSAPDAPGTAGPGRRQRRSWPLWVHFILAVLLIVLIRNFVAQSFYVPSGSMEPTLDVGDRVVVTKWDNTFHRGDVVVFNGTDIFGTTTPPRFSGTIGSVMEGVGGIFGIHVNESDYVKRIIGMPGDHVVCCDGQGRLMINDVSVTEPYLPEGVKASETTFDIKVPAGRLFMLGDNRSNSADSRAHLGDPGGGMVPVSDVIGRPAFRYWPLDRTGTIPGDSNLAAIAPAGGVG